MPNVNGAGPDNPNKVLVCSGFTSKRPGIRGSSGLAEKESSVEQNGAYGRHLAHIPPSCWSGRDYCSSIGSRDLVDQHLPSLRLSGTEAGFMEGRARRQRRSYGGKRKAISNLERNSPKMTPPPARTTKSAFIQNGWSRNLSWSRSRLSSTEAKSTTR